MTSLLLTPLFLVILGVFVTFLVLISPILGELVERGLSLTLLWASLIGFKKFQEKKFELKKSMEVKYPHLFPKHNFRRSTVFPLRGGEQIAYGMIVKSEEEKERLKEIIRKYEDLFKRDHKFIWK